MSGNRRRGGRRERGGSGARRALRSRRFDTTPLPYIQRNVPVFDVLSDEGLEIIEDNAEVIMEEVGIAIKDDPDTVAMWRDAGADVADDGETLHFPRGLARSLLATAPPSFVQRARNPQRSVKIGDGATVFAPVYGPPFIHNLDDGRRYATIEDFRNFVKLAYMTPAMHHSGGTVCEPVDVPVSKRHLDMVHAHLTYSDKPFMGSVTAPDRAEDTVELARIALGGETVDNHCCIINLINANSPMTFDGTMLGALKVYAGAGQACVVSPFILSGAMSPVTVAGTVAQILAEALVGMATTQLVRKGAPVVFGTFGSSISMQSGAPTFGTPEPALVLFASAQLARRLGVPFRSGGSLCGSKVPDAQAAYESAQTLLPTLLGGVNFVLHAAGWLEGGLASGYEKFVMDADQIGMMQVLGGGVDLSENGQAMDAIREVGPGNHFLGCDHTQNNFQSAFYRSTIADNNSFEQWQADGSLDAARRANQLWKDMLADYEAPAMDPAVAEELDDWIARRKVSLPDSFA